MNSNILRSIIDVKNVTSIKSGSDVKNINDIKSNSNSNSKKSALSSLSVRNEEKFSIIR